MDTPASFAISLMFIYATPPSSEIFSINMFHSHILLPPFWVSQLFRIFFILPTISIPYFCGFYTDGNVCNPEFTKGFVNFTLDVMGRFMLFSWKRNGYFFRAGDAIFLHPYMSNR